jgi:hypothetical protein
MKIRLGLSDLLGRIGDTFKESVEKHILEGVLSMARGIIDDVDDELHRKVPKVSESVVRELKSDKK